MLLTEDLMIITRIAADLDAVYIRAAIRYLYPSVKTREENIITRWIREWGTNGTS